ncbi:MAG: LacI family DNA-binding transcriptional regulator [Brooklawnia sp.]|jgi:LacI family transcriptional regulator
MRKRFPTDPGGDAPEPETTPVQRPRRVTIGDVAKRAGVSTATVSKYFGNRDYYVAEDTRKKIKAAVKELDYQPNAAARALARQRSQIIGVVVPSIVNPYYPELIAGIEEVTGERGYSLTVATTHHDPERESSALATMRQQRVAGLILGVAPPNEAVRQVMANGTEVVMVSRGTDLGSIDGVQVDNTRGAALATTHLVEHGHRQIALISGPGVATSFSQRAAGYREVCQAAGVDMIECEVEARYPTMAEGYAVAERLFAGHSPSAVFVASDLLAMGVLDFCEQRRIRVPQDLAIIGFDNIWVARLAQIALTTVDGATGEVGRTAAQRLISRLHPATEGEPEPREFSLLEPSLVIRRSCGCN